MDSSIPLQIAETIQTASINQNPDVRHDLNPSTAASQKTPVTIESSTYDGLDSDDELAEADEDDIPYDILRPVERQTTLPPLPDLRFEQSYLASIRDADTYWTVAYITIRDQLLFPLIQGAIWSLALHGWRYWNRTTALSGKTLGAKIRRWWWKTNNWPVPGDKVGRAKVAHEMGEFYKLKQGAGGD